MKFHINEPDHELTIGYFTIILKYSVLIASSWIFGWLLVLFLPLRDGVGYSNNTGAFALENRQIISCLLIIIVFIYYSYSLYNKSKFGLIKELEFSENTTKLNIINLVTGKNKLIEINNTNLKVILNEKHHPLFGRQREYRFEELHNLTAKFNVDMTAWVRHPEIDKIIQQLEKYI